MGCFWRTLLAIAGILFLAAALPSAAMAHEAHDGWSAARHQTAALHASMAVDPSLAAGACECCVGAPCCHAAMGAGEAGHGPAFGTARCSITSDTSASDLTSSPSDPPPRPRRA